MIQRIIQMKIRRIMNKEIPEYADPIHQEILRAQGLLQDKETLHLRRMWKNQADKRSYKDSTL